MSEHRPTCIWCSKPLAKHVEYVQAEGQPTEREVAWGNDGMPVVVDGRYVKQVTKVSRSSLDSVPFSYNVWLGDWGYDGQGAFHSGECAKRWAAYYVREIRAGRVELIRLKEVKR